jgi:16S rRNA C1402 N4-methylase RsmH
VEKERRKLEETVDNLKIDGEIMAVKFRNLEERVRKQNQTAARERRVEAKREQRKTKEFEVQVETLTVKLL